MSYFVTKLVDGSDNKLLIPEIKVLVVVKDSYATIMTMYHFCNLLHLMKDSLM